MAALLFVFGCAKNLQIPPLFQSDGRCPTLKQFDANFAINFYRTQFSGVVTTVYSLT
jgi:hypothetical protein